MNQKFRDPEFLSLFIDKYKEMSNLWHAKHKDYFNKPVRRATLERFLTFVQTWIPEADVDFVEKKIQILQNMYRKEKRKIEQSKTSGAAPGDVYVPRLWYFEKLRFLDDRCRPRESLSTLPSTLPCSIPSTSAEADEPSILEEADAPSWSQEELSQEEGGESGRQEEAVPSVSQEVAGPSRSMTTSQVPPLRLPSKRAKKNTLAQEESLRLIREATNVLNSPPDAEEAYGCYIASRLHQLEMGQRLHCERLIFLALQKGLSGELSANSNIVEQVPPVPPPPPPPPATSTPPETQPPRKATGKSAGKGAVKGGAKRRR
ncbi:uncharacterized protein LOC143984423 [Lithobates pipiens]